MGGESGWSGAERTTQPSSHIPSNILIPKQESSSPTRRILNSPVETLGTEQCLLEAHSSPVAQHQTTPRPTTASAQIETKSTHQPIHKSSSTAYCM